MRPPGYLFCPSVFDGIDVDVIDMPFKILFIPDQVFPISPLPYPAFTFACAACGTMFAMRKVAGERSFYQPPAQGEIAVVSRQCPDGMQVIRQYDNGIHRKGMAGSGVFKGAAQWRDVFDQKRRGTVGEIDREKVAGSGNVAATVIGHLVCVMGIATLNPSYALIISASSVPPALHNRRQIN
jgi:hypothetical protein